MKTCIFPPCFWQCQILVVVLVVTAFVKKKFFTLENVVVSVSSIIITLTTGLLKRDKHHSFQLESHEQKYPNFPLPIMSALIATVRSFWLMPSMVLMVHLKKIRGNLFECPFFNSKNPHLESYYNLKFNTTTRCTLWMEWIIFIGVK